MLQVVKSINKPEENDSNFQMWFYFHNVLFHNVPIWALIILKQYIFSSPEPKAHKMSL